MCGFPLLAPIIGLALVPTAAGQREPLLHQSGPLPGHGIKVTAKGAILIDAGDGTVLWAKHQHRRLRIASTTRIMTAIVAMERLRPHDVVRIDKGHTEGLAGIGSCRKDLLGLCHLRFECCARPDLRANLLKSYSGCSLVCSRSFLSPAIVIHVLTSD